MTVSPNPIHIVEADRFHDGIVIRFADGTIIFYTSEFLYEQKGADGNWEVVDDNS
jgi:hypothetical protein